eukprot:27896_1
MEAGYHWHQNATSQYDIIHSTYQLITNIYIRFYFTKIGVFHAVDAKHTEGDWQAKRINYVGKSSIVIVCRFNVRTTQYYLIHTVGSTCTCFDGYNMNQFVILSLTTISNGMLAQYMEAYITQVFT